MDTAYSHHNNVLLLSFLRRLFDALRRNNYVLTTDLEISPEDEGVSGPIVTHPRSLPHQEHLTRPLCHLNHWRSQCSEVMQVTEQVCKHFADLFLPRERRQLTCFDIMERHMRPVAIVQHDSVQVLFSESCKMIVPSFLYRLRGVAFPCHRSFPLIRSYCRIGVYDNVLARYLESAIEDEGVSCPVMPYPWSFPYQENLTWPLCHIYHWRIQCREVIQVVEQVCKHFADLFLPRERGQLTGVDIMERHTRVATIVQHDSVQVPFTESCKMIVPSFLYRCWGVPSPRHRLFWIGVYNNVLARYLEITLEYEGVSGPIVTHPWSFPHQENLTWHLCHLNHWRFQCREVIQVAEQVCKHFADIAHPRERGQLTGVDIMERHNRVVVIVQHDFVQVLFTKSCEMVVPSVLYRLWGVPAVARSQAGAPSQDHGENTPEHAHEHKSLSLDCVSQ